MSNLISTITAFIFLSLNLSVQGQTYAGKKIQGIPYRVKDKWGIADTSGNLIVPPTFDEALFMGESGYIKVRKGKKWGVYGAKGQRVLPLKYAFIADNVQNGYFSVYYKYNEDGKSRQGLVNASGKRLLPRKYVSTSFANDNPKIVIGGVRRWGGGRNIRFLDENGKPILPKVYYNKDSSVDFWLNGYIRIQDPDTRLYGLMAPSGKLVLPFKYSAIYQFQEGLIQVKDYTGEHTGGFHFLDKVGNPISPRKFHVVIRAFTGGFSDGRAPVGNEQEKYGFIDRQGNQVVDYIYDEVTEFRNGRAIVKKGSKYGAIDVNGKVVVPFIYDELKWNTISTEKVGTLVETPKPLHLAASIITGKVNGKQAYGLSHKDYQTPITYTYIEDNRNFFQDTYKGFLYWENNCAGAMDSTGKKVLPPVYDGVSYISEGRFPVIQEFNYSLDLGNTISRWKHLQMAFVDSSGRFITPYNYLYDHGVGYQNGIVVVKMIIDKDLRYFYLNKSGKPITDFTFEMTKPFKQGVGIFKNAQKPGKTIDGYGVINQEGKIVTKKPYPNIYDFNKEGLALVTTKEGKGLIDRQGNEVIPPKYDFESRDGAWLYPYFINGYILIKDPETKKAKGYMSLKQKQFWQD
jgi:hypothetical protein